MNLNEYIEHLKNISAKKEERRKSEQEPMTPLVLTCHYKNPEMTTMCLQTLIKTNPWVQKVLMIDTSVEQNAPGDIDPRVQVIPLPGATHSDGVQKGLDWAAARNYKGSKKNDKWVLLIDSDVLFDHDVRELFDRNYVLLGHKVQRAANIYGMVIAERIHPAFCLMNLTWLNEKKISFTNWSKITKENLPVFSNSPGEWDPKTVYKKGLRLLYDVGSTLYEEVRKNGGGIKSLGTLWEYCTHKRIKRATSVYHMGSISWRTVGDEKAEFCRQKYLSIINN